MLKLLNKRSFLHSPVAVAARESLWGGKSSLLPEAATNDFKSWCGFSTESAATGSKFQSNGDSGNKIFAPYSIFKGKAAMAVNPVLPKFTKMGSGNLKVERCGGIMLTFRPAIGERKYDSEKAQLFTLSATEVGSLISLGPNDSCEFFHDPGMLSSTAGQIRKKLSINALADGSGYFFSLNVVDNINNTNDRMFVPVSKGEFAVLKVTFSYALPHIMGWGQFTNQGVQISSSQISPKPVGELVGSEWDR